VLTKVLIAGGVKLDPSPNRLSVRSFALEMHHLGGREIQNMEPRICDPLAPIGFLKEKKEPFVQKANLWQALHVYGHAGTYYAGYNGGVPFGESEPVSRQAPVRQFPEQPWLWNGRGLCRAVWTQKLWTGKNGGRVLFKDLCKESDGIIAEFDVVIEDESVGLTYET